MSKKDNFVNEFVEATNEAVCLGCKNKIDDCLYNPCDRWVEKANEIAKCYAINSGQISIKTLLKM